MKKFFTTAVAIFAGCLMASAQQNIKSDPNEDTQDRLQQQPQRQTERRVESAAKESAIRVRGKKGNEDGTGNVAAKAKL